MSDALSSVLESGRSPRTGTVWIAFASNPDMAGCGRRRGSRRSARGGQTNCISLTFSSIMKLTPELIAHSKSALNPLKERQLDLRGLQIPAIENLGASRVSRPVR